MTTTHLLHTTITTLRALICYPLQVLVEVGVVLVKSELLFLLKFKVPPPTSIIIKNGCCFEEFLEEKSLNMQRTHVDEKTGLLTAGAGWFFIFCSETQRFAQGSSSYQHQERCFPGNFNLIIYLPLFLSLLLFSPFSKLIFSFSICPFSSFFFLSCHNNSLMEK